jgi:peptidoglycan-N-acetylglucosamine deacetylase
VGLLGCRRGADPDRPPQPLAGTQAELKALRAHIKLDLSPLRRVSLPDIAPVPLELSSSIRSVALPLGKKLIALTFDLCEAAGDVSGYDGRIIDLLRAQGGEGHILRRRQVDDG